MTSGSSLVGLLARTSGLINPVFDLVGYLVQKGAEIEKIEKHAAGIGHLLGGIKLCVSWAGGGPPFSVFAGEVTTPAVLCILPFKLPCVYFHNSNAAYFAVVQVLLFVWRLVLLCLCAVVGGNFDCYSTRALNSS